MSQKEIDPNMRQVVNANFDTSNVVEMEKTTDRIRQTLDICAGYLKDHCGPKSGYAMLIDSATVCNFQPSQFTRDGIRIMKAIDFMAPLETYVKNILTYVGERVDKVAKDGTTTSMLFTALFLSKMLLDKQNVKTGSKLSLYQITSLVDSIIRELQKNLHEECTLTIKDFLPEEYTPEEELHVAGKLAYIQALSSSGGDFELAEAMKRIFEASPKETWDVIDYETATKETDRRFTVQVDDYDARIKCITATTDALNTALNTEYEAKDALVFVFTTAVMQMSFPCMQFIEWLRKADPKQPIVILSTMVDGRLTAEINMMNQQREVPITIWNFAPEEQVGGQVLTWELVVLAAKCGMTPIDMDNTFTGKVDPSKYAFKANVHWKDSYMYFYDCVPHDEGSVLHKFYTHPEDATDFYRQTVDQAKAILDSYKDGHHPDGRMYSHFMRVLNELISYKRPHLLIGGASHEIVASKDVVEDVIGAIMSSLNHGFVVDGIGSLDTQQIKSSKYGKKGTPQYNYVSDFMIAFELAAAEIFHEIYDTHNADSSKLKELTGGMSKFEYINNLVLPLHRSDIRDYLEMMDAFVEITNWKLNYPTMQPMKVTEELLKRLQELVVKVVLANKAIVYGGVVLNEDTNKKKKEEEEYGDRGPFQYPGW